MTSLSPVLGTNEDGGIGVAGPKRRHDKAPRTTSSAAGTQLASAPTLFSHLPMLRPTTLSATASVRPVIATTMKYALLDDQDCQASPPMKSAFAAAKYSNPGKYGRFEPQYVQPVMNAANGPN